MNPESRCRAYEGKGRQKGLFAHFLSLKYDIALLNIPIKFVSTAVYARSVTHMKPAMSCRMRIFLREVSCIERTEMKDGMKPIHCTKREYESMMKV